MNWLWSAIVLSLLLSMCSSMIGPANRQGERRPLQPVTTPVSKSNYISQYQEKFFLIVLPDQTELDPLCNDKKYPAGVICSKHGWALYRLCTKAPQATDADLCIEPNTNLVADGYTIGREKLTVTDAKNMIKNGQVISFRKLSLTQQSIIINTLRAQPDYNLTGVPSDPYIKAN
jgi:hypothetical protein